MNSCRRNTLSYDSGTFGVFLSIIFGVAAGLLFFNGFLPTISTGIIVAAVVAAIALILFWVSVISRKPYTDNDCICENFGLLLTGIIGTLVSAFVIFSVDFVIGSTVFAILIGLAAFFFALTLTGIVTYLGCLADCDDCDCGCE
ncbi:MAG: hypothetical protein IKT39_02250 [Clostridia bacterium]|nr:hypothetical protein [Clostridia bacterium]